MQKLHMNYQNMMISEEAYELQEQAHQIQLCPKE